MNANTYKLIALDIDGTILDSKKRLRSRVIQSIHACRQRGAKVVLASARPPRSVRKIHHLLQLDTLSIHYNGALIYDLTSNKTIHHQPLDAAIAKRVIQVARNAYPDCTVSVEILDKWYTDQFNPDLITETGRDFQPDFIGPLDAFLTVPVTKLMLLAEPQHMQLILAAVRRRFKREFAIAISDDHLLQIMHPESCKSTALQQVARIYDIQQSEVVAIGDAPNDAAMIQWAGLGIAMENAWPNVIQRADAITRTNDSDGVAHALNQHVLN